MSILFRRMILHPDVVRDLLLVEKMLPRPPRDGVLRCMLCDWTEPVQYSKDEETGWETPDHRPVYRHTREAHPEQVKKWGREIAEQVGKMGKEGRG